jgi:hypothetical protein
MLCGKGSAVSVGTGYMIVEEVIWERVEITLS